MIADETLIGFLGRVLTTGVVHVANPDDSVTLVEEDPNGRMEVTVDAIEEPFVVVKPQQMSHLACTTGPKIRWVCDYLIILRCEDHLRAVFVELKKTFRYGSNAPEQLRRSLPLLRYLEAIYSVDSQTPEDRTKVAYAVVYERGPRLDKQVTRPKRKLELMSHENIDIVTLLGSGPFGIEEMLRGLG